MLDADGSNQSFQLLLDLMQRGDTFILIFVAYYDSLKDFLIKHGFKENLDFINGRHMIPRNQDGLLEPDKVAIYNM